MSSKIQNINRRLTILQYNVHTSKDLVITSCLRDFVIKKFDILAIQKLWRNIHTTIIHHFLKKYILINILRFEENKRKRSKSMLLREQTHIHSRFKLLFQIRKFNHTTNKIDRKFQRRTLYSNTQSIQRI